ncbi:MAG: SIMPL domain-containing protein [Neisseria sp.]|nr:SIMPL domain-containing protein [Neisseria sp.]
MSEESRRQILEKEGRLPDYVIACVGGGSNAIGAFSQYVADEEVKLVGVEAAGHGLDTDKHAATMTKGSIGIVDGMKTYAVFKEDGELAPVYSISAGLDYPGVGPEHAYFKVESKDFEALNRLIADSINIAVLESSSFSVSKEKREETVDQLSKAVILRFKDRAQNLAQTLGFSSYKIVKLNLGHIGNRQVGGDFARAKMLRAAPVAEMAAGIEDGIPASPGSEEISLTVSGSVQM